MLRLVRVEVPLRRLHQSSREQERVRDVVLVEWTRHDAVSGWGECPTLSSDAYVTGSTEAAWRALVTVIAPAVLAGTASARTASVGTASVGTASAGTASAGTASAGTAVDCGGPLAAWGAVRDARLDSRLRSTGTALTSHLGAVRPTVARTRVIADLGGDEMDTADAARVAAVAGARMIKVKVAPGDDVERVRAVMGAVGVPVAADANGSYESPAQLAALDSIGLAYLEQPFSHELGWGELAGMQRELTTRIALDESITSPADLHAACGAGALDIVSLKPARLGGVEAAVAVGRAASSRGLGVFVGGMLELAVGRAGAAALAACAFCDLPADLGPSSDYVIDDIADPVVLDDTGDLVVPTGPGCGRSPDASTLASVRTAELVLA